MPQSITITTPVDFHLHVRNGEILKAVMPHTAKEYGAALIMPNLKPPIVTLASAVAYRDEILEALPSDSTFNPLMSLYFTQNLTSRDVKDAYESGLVKAVKLYPAGATTNSDFGVTDYDGIQGVLETMAEIGMPLLIHGEVTDEAIDIFDREARFIEDILTPIRERVPDLKVVMEHITTKEAVQYVLDADDHLGATITPHHLLLNRNAIFHGGINPHHYCLPILKREGHRQALVDAATSGNKKFFLGTDSAPHAKGTKECACGCAGIYTAFSSLPLYAEVFEMAGALDKLEGFASHFGADFYGIPRNEGTITLRKADTPIPDSFTIGDDVIVPFRAGGSVSWTVVNQV
ncbi:MAG: dihydroorotase [Desulfobacterales bacterium]|nr:dihydroorotase [Desulfobacterales bacterium]